MRLGAELARLARQGRQLLSRWRPLAIAQLNLGSSHYACGITGSVIWHASKRFKNAFR
jgi:hypothetical protein